MNLFTFAFALAFVVASVTGVVVPRLAIDEAHTDSSAINRRWDHGRCTFCAQIYQECNDVNGGRTISQPTSIFHTLRMETKTTSRCIQRAVLAIVFSLRIFRTRRVFASPWKTRVLRWCISIRMAIRERRSRINTTDVSGMKTPSKVSTIPVAQADPWGMDGRHTGLQEWAWRFHWTK